MRFFAGVLVGVVVGALAFVLIGDVFGLDGFARYALVILTGGAVVLLAQAVGERFRRGASSSDR